VVASPTGVNSDADLDGASCGTGVRLASAPRAMPESPERSSGTAVARGAGARTALGAGVMRAGASEDADAAAGAVAAATTGTGRGVAPAARWPGMEEYIAVVRSSAGTGVAAAAPGLEARGLGAEAPGLDPRGLGTTPAARWPGMEEYIAVVRSSAGTTVGAGVALAGAALEASAREGGGITPRP
jgi:hypothetical protein